MHLAFAVSLLPLPSLSAGPRARPFNIVVEAPDSIICEVRMREARARTPVLVGR